MKIAPFSEWMARIQARCENSLADCLPDARQKPARLHQAMRYAVLGGGKRVRPLLVFAAGEIVGADPDRLEATACAVELIHAYSLVHDDLPCMDNDVLRRGRPTCHIAFDEATALLVGDALQTHAFLWLAQAPGLNGLTAERRLKMVTLLAEASGSLGMAGGQAIDLAAVGTSLDQAALEDMHARKTGALIRAAILLGALCGDAENNDAVTLEALGRFAGSAGLLFQVIDDILDATTDSQTLGKTAGKDAVANKPTFVSLMGLDPARHYANALKNEALAALSPFGEQALRLRQLTDFIADRRS